ncbi:MAG: transcription-repair coupling factor [Firmicutes bacterium]|jgi:transcription-repair coupling factor (superfamily II helicase)|nr:transcription-repair coupling factor [Bacillota bacterium]
MGIRQIASANQGIAEVLSRLRSGGHYLVQGVSGSQRALLANLVVEQQQRPVLFVTDTLKDAMALLADYQFFSDGPGFVFPAPPTLGAQVDAESHELESQRVHALQQVVAGNPCLVVAPAKALLELLPPPEYLQANITTLSPGDQMPIEELATRLAQMGYQRVERVSGAGQYSQRGDIFDVFPPLGEPARIEFFDVAIESVRSIDLTTQRSRHTLPGLTLGPVHLLSLTPELRQKAIDMLTEREKNLSPVFLPQLVEDRERFGNLQSWPGARYYMEYLFARRSNLLDYFRQGAVMTAEVAVLLEHLELHADELREKHQSLLEAGKLLPGLQPWLTVDEVVHQWTPPTLHLSLLSTTVKNLRLSGISNLSFRQAPNFYGQQQLIVDEIKAWLKRHATVVAVGAGRHLAEALRAQDIPVRIAGIADLRPGNVNFVPGSISAGLELPEQGLVILSLNELTARKRRTKRPGQEGMRAGDIETLTPGEYVVHYTHGIGQYLGIVGREVAGAKRDYLYIKYAGKDRLYLPTDQVHLLQRYLGGNDKPPKLYALGGGDWLRVKARVKESVKKLAFDLLELYAARQAAVGHAFSPDSPWQRELEDSFAYQETSDQLKAIEEVKRDMESPRPMDRLLCGDVGYGKTEVALRAAMKAVLDGKQVAILAPTTILAQQHYNTFRERFAPFPIRVEVLSRLKTPGEQEKIVAATAQGAVDILIGTHRLLQKDIRFPDLGLLVVDEEQRFGVEHKEKIKQMKANVDILTMTATPIPRTLHMALLGIRDLSVINTPPEGRFPVQTYVMEYSDELVVSAVRRELDRDGQVYVIYNRVQGIDALASRLRRLLPGVSIGVIHGQMAETLLERTMLDFYEGNYQVLLSTTIIENGLDIPNVNTVIVYDSDRLGLSQLYQLRGRVGRGRKLAYAYFTYRKDKVLTEKSQKRLSAIKEFTELGAGYKLSLRDMEIRGTGNILGPEQHGHIAAVGFDLYCQLLEQQVAQLTNRPKESKIPSEVNIELPVDAYIPDGYMPEKEKIYVYRRIKEAGTIAVIDDIQDELGDRFGKLPPPLETLLDVGRIRSLALSLGIGSISWSSEQLTGKEKVTLSFRGGKGPSPRVMQDIWLHNKGKIDFRNKNNILTVSLTTTRTIMLEDIEGLLHQLKTSIEKQGNI